MRVYQTRHGGDILRRLPPVLAPRKSLIENLKKTLLKKLAVEESGHPTQFLGIELLCRHEWMIGHRQSMLIEKHLCKYGTEGMKETCNPMNPFDEVPRLAPPLDEERAWAYRNIVGSPLYISIKTGADISTAASILGTNVSRAEAKHFKESQQFLRYLRATAHCVFVSRPSTQKQFNAHFDASWGG